ncbi:MAG: BlaI/MecI/CopY family transcriptional regulator [Clostridia bacterium]|nr:BlaI/MecI/CopY family transcriptional regulator [Clostridia bacterium]
MDQERLSEQEEEKKETAHHEDGAQKLPDAELETMLAVWNCEPPVTTARIMRLIDPERSWKTPTLISFLQRLEKRGFLSSEKHGREYVYEAKISRQAYIGELTRSFLLKAHGGSLFSFLTSAYGEEGLSGDAVDDLLLFLERHG